MQEVQCPYDHEDSKGLNKNCTFTFEFHFATIMAGTFRTIDENHSLFSLLRKEPCWWQFLKKDKDLYIAIRKDNYLNVYYQDGCLAKIFIGEDGTIKATTHRKYLSGIDCSFYEGEYFDVSVSLTNPQTTEGTISRIKNNISNFYNNRETDIDGRLSENYIKWEWAVSHPKDIIDLEMAFYKERKKVRLDIIQLSYGDIIFTELKRINDGRMLKKDPHIEPEIISQMAYYCAFIAKNAEELLLYYQKIYRIKKSLGLPVSYQSPKNVRLIPLLSIVNTYSFMTTKRYDRIGRYDSSEKKFISGILKHTTNHSTEFDTEIFRRLHRTTHVFSQFYKEGERKKALNSAIHGSKMNLHSSIMEDALTYFKSNNISWWKIGTEDGKQPTSHSLSSQVHCLNHLFSIRNDDRAVLKMIRNTIPEIDFESVLKVPIDTVDTQGFISFEFTYKNKSLLSESHESRGENCTSIDAVIYAKDTSGKYWLIPIEWKYTEQQYDGKEAFAGSILRYPKYVTKTSNLKSWDIIYRADPYYELSRQTLLVEQMIANPNPDFPVDDYCHIFVCPERNPLKMAIELNYVPTLKDKAKFRIISPKNLTESVLPEEIKEYLQERYW